ncbi:hypothetical protein BJY52DRAFT_1227422 [Lactarius psammicola]|nr:hypothetical protein BJY52DRAFT_1227422 [Lactarius psammicola]
MNEGAECITYHRIRRLPKSVARGGAHTRWTILAQAWLTRFDYKSQKHDDNGRSIVEWSPDDGLHRGPTLVLSKEARRGTTWTREDRDTHSSSRQSRDCVSGSGPRPSRHLPTSPRVVPPTGTHGHKIPPSYMTHGRRLEPIIKMNNKRFMSETSYKWTCGATQRNRNLTTDHKTQTRGQVRLQLEKLKLVVVVVVVVARRKRARGT